MYIPCTPSDEDDGQLRLTLFRTADGDVSLMAFSALDRLVDGVGGRTSWALVRWDDMLQIHQESPFDRIHVDATILQNVDEQAAV